MVDEVDVQVCVLFTCLRIGDFLELDHFRFCHGATGVHTPPFTHISFILLVLAKIYFMILNLRISKSHLYK